MHLPIKRKERKKKKDSPDRENETKVSLRPSIRELPFPTIEPIRP